MQDIQVVRRAAITQTNCTACEFRTKALWSVFDNGRSSSIDAHVSPKTNTPFPFL